jgi:hypothetical protein
MLINDSAVSCDNKKNFHIHFKYAKDNNYNTVIMIFFISYSNLYRLLQINKMKTSLKNAFFKSVTKVNDIEKYQQSIVNVAKKWLYKEFKLVLYINVYSRPQKSCPIFFVMSLSFKLHNINLIQ